MRLFILFLLFGCTSFSSGNYYQLKKDENPVTLAIKFQLPLCLLRLENEKSLFKKGDWVFIPRNEGLLGGYRDCVSTEKYLETGEFLWPLKKNTKISSQFGMRWNRHHNGIDIPGKINTLIYAAKAGRIIFSGHRKGGHGNLVILSHLDGTTTYYAHNQRNFFKQEKWVEKGMAIATLGMTGNATGPHLHFEIRKDGDPLNPLFFYALGKHK